jgi:transposase
MKGVISMSTREADRVGIIQRLVNREIRQRHAAKIIGLSTRQIKRLVRQYRRYGTTGLVHKGRGKVSNRAILEEEKRKMIDILSNNYADFGPTLAWEKLVENHGIKYSDETIRKLMIGAELWKARKRKVIHLHQLRERRDCLGELVQTDGSPHDWFEGRSPQCTLLVFIDDATGRLLHLEFAECESTIVYFKAVRRYLEKHGRPVTFYVDKHGVFRINTTKGGSADTSDNNGLTQFGRAMTELSIGCIFAESAEAKGRVERVNQTLQDRLVKEMRLKGINTVEEGNKYLPEFIELFNRKFAVVPKSPANMHRPLLPVHNLNDILCLKYTRIMSKQLSISYGNRIYQIQTERPAYAMRNAPVTLQEDINGGIKIVYKGQPLNYTIIRKQPKTETADSKYLNIAVDRISASLGIPIKVVDRIPVKPAMSHPWRQYQQLIN